MGVPREFRVVAEGRWSGGGSVFLANALEAVERYRVLQGGDEAIPILARNVPKGGRYPRQKFVLAPQNAWVWQRVASGAPERALVSALRLGTEVSYRRACGVVRISEAIRPHAHVPTSEVIHNVLDRGFDQVRQDALESEAPDAEGAIVCVGSNLGFRDLPLLVRAHRRYREAGGTRPLVLISAQGRAAAERELEAELARSKGLAVRKQRSTRTECVSAMARAHLVVFPSRVEASPVSVLEAGAVAQRVLVSDIAGHRGLVASVGDGGSHPAYFAAHDEADLARALVEQEDSTAGMWATGLEQPECRKAARAAWGNRLTGFLETIGQGLETASRSTNA